MQNKNALDIYDFIPSPDVAEHCRRIGHVFSPADMAVLIDKSGKTMEERHDAWRAILHNYPDSILTKDWIGKVQTRLHDALREKMDFEEKYLASFLAPGEGEIYMGELNEGERAPYPQGVYMSIREEVFGRFSTFGKALQGLEERRECDALDVEQADILKETIDRAAPFQSVRVNRLGEVICVNGGRSSGLNSEILSLTFVDIPIPFEKGDIVTVDGKIPAVLYDMAHWHGDYQNRVERNYSNGWDNCASCYLVTEDGKLTHCSGAPFLTQEIRYYRGELKGKEKFLEYVSYYVKNGQSADWLLNAWLPFYTQVQAEKAKDGFSGYASLRSLHG